MSPHTLIRSVCRVIGYLAIASIVLVKLFVVLLVTLSELSHSDGINLDVDAYCDGATDALELDEILDDAMPNTQVDSPVTECVTVDYSALTWNELRACAKSLGCTSLKTKRDVLSYLHITPVCDSTSVIV